MDFKNLMDCISCKPRVRHMGVHMARNYPILTDEQKAAQEILYQKIYDKLLDFAKPGAVKGVVVNITKEIYAEELSDQIYGKIQIECCADDKSESVFINLDRCENPYDINAWYIQGSCGLVNPVIDLVNTILEENIVDA